MSKVTSDAERNWKQVGSLLCSLVCESLKNKEVLDQIKLIPDAQLDLIVSYACSLDEFRAKNEWVRNDLRPVQMAVIEFVKNSEQWRTLSSLERALRESANGKYHTFMILPIDDMERELRKMLEASPQPMPIPGKPPRRQR